MSLLSTQLVQENKGESKNYEIYNDELINSLAKKYNVSPQLILLNYAVSRDIIVIPKSSSEKRIIENKKCLEFRLTPDELKSFEKLDDNKFFYLVKTIDYLGNICPNS